MSINERLRDSLINHSSDEFSERLKVALAISRESGQKQSGIRGRIRRIIQEPALMVTLSAMRAGQILGASWIAETPVDAELNSFEGRPYWKSRNLRLEAIRHGITLPLTLASTATLEAISIASGTFLAGVNPFSELDSKLAVGTLLLSYGFWAFGMGTNAQQAWKMLDETGVSVSWWAKVGYDISKRLTEQPKIQKAATYLGFSTLEVVKEIPWWLGAFGGKFALNQIYPEMNTQNIEFSFLMGANFGAAVFNFFQAGGVKGTLRFIRHIKN